MRNTIRASLFLLGSRQNNLIVIWAFFQVLFLFLLIRVGKEIHTKRTKARVLLLNIVIPIHREKKWNKERKVYITGTKAQIQNRRQKALKHKMKSMILVGVIIKSAATHNMKRNSVRFRRIWNFYSRNYSFRTPI